MVKQYFTTLKEKIYNGNSKIYLYGLTVLLFWAKTQVAYARTFNSLQVTNFWQHLIILVTPFSFLLVYFAIPFLIKKKKVANLVLVIMQIALSIFYMHLFYIFVLFLTFYPLIQFYMLRLARLGR
ncbi:glycerol phosphate lipoteichoic acid synthase [Fructobacillus pseudoficulneus]|uniref:Glycerol phosphate lipoteichoic acid synthase n=1 Tax=Fructobacillus pseudoficulneus TaxID=220714 RepID=A0A3F3GRP2_9LACO|nr:glycerol phosphate lipoteichoic acid synthase [Fructobacillus pseudoficulneus]